MRDYLRRTIYNRSWVLDLMVACLLVTTIFFLIGQRNLTNQVKVLAEENKSLNEQTVALSHQIKDCIDPTGTCYIQGQRQRKDSLDTIIASIACADKDGTQSAAVIQKCVVDSLKSH